MNRIARFSVYTAFLVSMLIAAHAAMAGSVRIMPVGDSDTSGFRQYVSYRYDLWFLLKQAGFDVEFVGRRDMPYQGYDPNLYPRYDEIDPYHEAAYLALISEISSEAAEMIDTNRQREKFLASNWFDALENPLPQVDLKLAKSVQTLVVPGGAHRCWTHISQRAKAFCDNTYTT